MLIRKSIQLEKTVTKCEKEIKRLKQEILHLEEKANDYKLIADNMTRSRAHYLHECESLVDKYNSLMNDYNSLVEKYNTL